MRARFSAAAALAVAGVLTISCGGIIDPSKNVTDSFNGTVAVKGVTGFHSFTASKTGEYTVRITALAPSNSIVLGVDVALGNNDGSCSSQLYQRNQFATLNTPAITGQILSGKYCVVVYDVGALTVPATYTITVSHP